MMTQQEIDLMNFENELLHTRRKLNDLIYQLSHQEQTPEDRALCQEKIFYLETELTYMNQQFRLLKNRQAAQASTQFAQTQGGRPQAAFGAEPARKPQTTAQSAQAQEPQTTAQSSQTQEPQTALSFHTEPPRKDYERIFGKSFMGIFASVLIFISLIIFATLMLPYLTDSIKLAGLYVLSFGLLLAGLLLSKKNPSNKFHLAVIGCGAGSLYITLLLSNLYFKVFGDILLYAFILVWAVFVRYLSRLKSLVFHMIGQLGILIATILGTALCVSDADAEKFLVLVIFYFISAVVFSNVILPLLHQNMTNHIFRLLNVSVLTIGIFCLKLVSAPESAVPRTIAVILLLLFLFMEYFLIYREKYESGIAFQILTTASSCLFFCLLNRLTDWPEDVFPALVYALSLLLLFYITKKNAGYRILSELFCFLFIWTACWQSGFISRHLYAFLTAIPCLLYGGFRKEKTYLYAGIAYIFVFLPMADGPEHLLMILITYAIFCYFGFKTDDLPFRLAGYLTLTLAMTILVYDCCYDFFRNNDISFGRTKAELIAFFVIAALHLILSKFRYLGSEKPIEIMTYLINGLLMLTGCLFLYSSVWQLPLILVTVLLFIVNSRRLLLKDARAGYYVALKYTILMVCILDSYETVSYLISISLLVFAILSIIVGFYKDTVTFRLYGLVLSMISVIKLIMFDIRYDSALENAVSFFVCGLLCFFISFLYNRIDHSLRKK